MTDTMPRKYSALIIEDDPLILDILVFKFRNKEWEVSSAMDGEAGLKKAAESKPDIIMLDISLPGISGYEVLVALKADPDLASIPVLILSNYGQPEEIDKSLALGAVDHLIKANVIIDEVVDFAIKIIAGTYTRDLKDALSDRDMNNL
jgi:CheY-like chemotaxis protein